MLKLTVFFFNVKILYLPENITIFDKSHERKKKKKWRQTTNSLTKYS